MVTFDMIRSNEEIRTYIAKGNANLGVRGFTEHAFGHAMKVADTASRILTALEYAEREIELAKIAGFMHDLGNCINRTDHAHTGALMAMQILRDMQMPPAEIAVIAAAIGNHDEKTGTAVDAVSAALILADKTDVRRSRVRPQERSSFDIHDRVNYAVTGNRLEIDPEKRKLRLEIEVDEEICTMYEYFDIFLGRMLMCRAAAEMLNAKFSLVVNGSKVL